MPIIAKTSLTVLKATGLGVSTGIWMPVIEQLPEYTIVVAMSGLAGGVCRWIADKSSVLDGVGAVISGGLIAVFVWPLGQAMTEGIVGKLELEPVTTAMLGGFITGVLGIALIGGILDVFRARTKRLEDVDAPD